MIKVRKILVLLYCITILSQFTIVLTMEYKKTGTHTTAAASKKGKFSKLKKHLYYNILQYLNIKSKIIYSHILMRNAEVKIPSLLPLARQFLHFDGFPAEFKIGWNKHHTFEQFFLLQNELFTHPASYGIDDQTPKPEDLAALFKSDSPTNMDHHTSVTFVNYTSDKWEKSSASFHYKSQSMHPKGFKSPGFPHLLIFAFKDIPPQIITPSDLEIMMVHYDKGSRYGCYYEFLCPVHNWIVFINYYSQSEEFHIYPTMVNRLQNMDYYKGICKDFSPVNLRQYAIQKENIYGRGGNALQLRYWDSDPECNLFFSRLMRKLAPNDFQLNNIFEGLEYVYIRFA